VPLETLFERQPAVVAIMKPEMQTRLAAAKEHAQPAPDNALRHRMDCLLDLIRAAGPAQTRAA
jgi:hypothetical protein